MRLIVTGASGFVGTNVSAYLCKHDHQIYPVSLRNNWYDKLPNDSDVCIHLAGIAHDTKNGLNPEEYFDINTELTKKIFEVFLRSSSTTFIYFSSIKAVTDTSQEILTEEISPNPQTAYGQSKLKAEQYLLSHLGEKRIIILRPCMIHGPGNKGNLNLLFQFVRKGLPYPLGAFNNLRSLLSIDNLCFSIEKMVNDLSFPSGIYNMADDLPLSTCKIVEIMGEVMHKKSRIWKIQRGLIRKIARSGDYLHLPLSTERLMKLTENYVVSNQKIKDTLKINHLPLTAEEGLKKTINSFIN